MFLAIGCTESNSEGVNVSDTSTNGEDVLSTKPEDVATTAGEMTNIFPRKATEADYDTKTQDIDGIIIDNQKGLLGTIDIDQIPVTVWMDESMSQGVIITDYRIEVEEPSKHNAGYMEFKLNLECVGIHVVDICMGTVIPSSTVFDPRFGSHYIIYEGHPRDAIISCRDDELPEKIVIDIRDISK